MALLSGSIVTAVGPNRARLANVSLAAVLAALLLVNLPHARPEKLTDVTDADFSPEIIAGRYLAVTTAMEYEPIWVQERPSRPAAGPAVLIDGRGRIDPIRTTPTEKELMVEVVDEARLRINTFFFPGWSVEVNGSPRPIDRGNPQGLMELTLEPGIHHIRAAFGSTPIRTAAAGLSLTAVLLLLAQRAFRIPWRPLGDGSLTPVSWPLRHAAVRSASAAQTKLVLVLTGGMLLFSVGTAYMNWVKYTSLRSTWPTDLGFFHNAAFNAAHGRMFTYFGVSAWFDRQEHEGPSVFRSPHFSPMQSLVMPLLYRPVPRIEMLMLLQSTLLALGAIPLFWLGAARSGEMKLGLALGLTYLLHPAILHLAFNDYRPVALGIPLALFALWFHASRRPLPFVAASVLMLSCQAEYLFLLAFFGLVNWRMGDRKANRLGWTIAPMVLALLWFGITQLYFLHAYDRFWPILAFAAQSQPITQRLIDLAERLRIFFLIGQLPAAIAIAIPEAFIIALPFTSLATGVGPPSFPHHNLQHLSPALAVMFWAFAGGVVWIWERLRQSRVRVVWLCALLLIVALASFANFGWGAARTYVVGGFPRYDELTRINDALPWDATVLVPSDLAARFSNHARVVMLDALPMAKGFRLSDGEKRSIIERLIATGDLVAAGQGDVWIDELVARSGRYFPARSVSGFRVFVARSDGPRVINPDVVLQDAFHWNDMSRWERRWLGAPI
jgi:hypothetical protein